MDILDRTFDAIRGVPCWNVEWEPQLGLKLSFGKPRLAVREPETTNAKSRLVQRLFAHRKITVKGDWWLWVWCGRWSLKLGDSSDRVTKSTPLRAKREALGLLDGQKLIDATVNRETGSMNLAFDLGAELRLWGSVAPDREIYALYKPKGYVLVVRADGMYSHEFGTHPERWRPACAAT